jgi:hypothetical protein
MGCGPLRSVGLALLVVASGCGKPADVGLIPVTGQLFCQSQPAEGALVILHPTSGANPKNWPHGLPHAIVAQDGTFQVSLPPLGEGAPAGDYKVLVTWQAPVPNADPTDTEPETVDRLQGRWSSPEKSTLTAAVQAPNTHLPRFDVK